MALTLLLREEMACVMATTSEDFAYGSVLNLFGSDPESPDEHSVLAALRGRAERSHFKHGDRVRVVDAPDRSDFDASFIASHPATGQAWVEAAIRWRGDAPVVAVPIPCVTPKAA